MEINSKPERSQGDFISENSLKKAVKNATNEIKNSSNNLLEDLTELESQVIPVRRD